MSNFENERLLLVANPGEVHVGAHLANAARMLGIQMHLVDIHGAYSKNIWINRFHYHLRGRGVAKIRQFSRSVVDACSTFKPTVLLATGQFPLNAAALEAIRRLGVRTCNFLTDDPFNPVHRASWFLRTLPQYDFIFTPRRSNASDLRAAGCRDVSYLRFAYSPEIHFPQPPVGPNEIAEFASDVFFAGGADKDRVDYFASMIQAGFNVALYGGYWDRYPETRVAARGQANAETVRKAAAGARVSICLVRRANRDGHSMRTFELPAMRACSLVEDTDEHREIFGTEGECVTYFQTGEEMLAKVRRLLKDDGERERLAAAAYARICGGSNRYADRLRSMIDYIRGGL